MLTKAVAEHRMVDVHIGQDSGMPFHVDLALAELLLELAARLKGFGELCRGGGAAGSVMLGEVRAWLLRFSRDSRNRCI